MSLIEHAMRPGEALKELRLDPLEMGAIAFTHALGVLRVQIVRLIKGKTEIALDTALRLSCVFNMTPAYWVNMQTNYEVAVGEKQINVSDVDPLVAA